MLNELAESDRINIHLFSSNIESMLPSSKLLTENVWQTAQKYVNEIEATGATNLFIGLQKALEVGEGI